MSAAGRFFVTPHAATVLPSLDPAMLPVVITILPATRGKDKRRGMLTWKRSTWRRL